VRTEAHDARRVREDVHHQGTSNAMKLAWWIFSTCRTVSAAEQQHALRAPAIVLATNSGAISLSGAAAVPAR